MQLNNNPYRSSSQPGAGAPHAKRENKRSGDGKRIAIAGLLISIAGSTPLLVAAAELAGLLTLEQWAQGWSITIYLNVLSPVGLIVSLYALMKGRRHVALSGVLIAVLGVMILVSAIEEAYNLGDGPIAAELRRWGFRIEPHPYEFRE